jgi:uncharacterized membrane protein HdeD (DUF308 family)
MNDMKKQTHHRLAQFWWLLAFRGILGIFLGLVALSWVSALQGWLGNGLAESTFQVLNGTVFLTLVLVFGPYAFFDGVCAVALGVQDLREGRRWWVLILEGLMGIGLGLMTLSWPHVNALMLLYWLGAWALATGALEIVQAYHLGPYREGKVPLLGAGFCSILFGLFAGLYHGADEGAMVWALGVYALAFGAFLLAMAFRIRPR